MKRKINRVGTNTLTVSLPSKWAKEQGLKPGEEVDAVEEGSSLVINTKEKKREKKAIELNIEDESKRFLRIKLTSTYRKGYDRIVLKFNKENRVKEVMEIVDKHLIGFDILKNEERRVVLENIIESSDEKNEDLFKRIFYLILDSCNIVKESMKTGKFDGLEQLKINETRVNKFTNYFRRNLTIYEDKNSAIPLWTLSSENTEMLHHLTFLYEYLLSKKTDASKYLKIMEGIIDMRKNIFDGLYRKNIESLQKVNKIKEAIHDKLCLKLIKDKNYDSLVIHYFMVCMRNTYISISQVIPLIES